MNKDLIRLRKEIAKLGALNKEDYICKALRVIFWDIDEGISEEEAFKILGWNYKSKEELFLK